jgi:hypothetical protein
MATPSLNKFYNFSLYPISILGSSYSNAKLISIMDYRTALKFDNIELLNVQIYPYLPPGTPSDHTAYTYYLFYVDGKTVVLASYWIIDESIEELTTLTKTIRFNNISDTQFTVIRDQLRLLGVSFDVL